MILPTAIAPQSQHALPFPRWNLELSAGVLVLAVCLACAPGLDNFAMGPKWAVVGIGVPLLLYWARPHWPACRIMALGLLWAALTFQWAPHHFSAGWGLWQMVLLAGAFALGTSLRNLNWLTLGLCAGIGVNSTFVIAELLGWSPFPPVAPPAGLFANRGVLAGIAVLAIILALSTRKWWFWAGICLPSLLFTHSRAATLGLAVAGSLWAARKGRVWWILAGWTGLFLAYGLWKGDALRFDTAIGHRLAIWVDLLPGMALFGQGIGQFEPLFPYLNLRLDTLSGRMEFAHNDPLQLCFELGLGAGLVLWGIFRPALCEHPAGYALVALFVISLFDFPLHLPHGILLAGLLAGHLSRSGTGDGDKPDDCRV